MLIFIGCKYKILMTHTYGEIDDYCGTSDLKIEEKELFLDGNDFIKLIDKLMLDDDFSSIKFDLGFLTITQQDIFTGIINTYSFTILEENLIEL